MISALLFIVALSAVALIIALTAMFESNAFEEYRRNIIFLIKLLYNKGYYPEQIINILNLYD
jgi:hypothetical protein